MTVIAQRQQTSTHHHTQYQWLGYRMGSQIEAHENNIGVPRANAVSHIEAEK